MRQLHVPIAIVHSGDAINGKSTIGKKYVQCAYRKRLLAEMSMSFTALCCVHSSLKIDSLKTVSENGKFNYNLSICLTNWTWLR